MEQQTLLSDLLSKVQEFVDEQGYSIGTWRWYKTAINAIIRFYSANETDVYSAELTWQLVSNRRKQYESSEISYASFLYIWKVSEMLKECRKTGNVIRRRSQAWSHEKLNPKNTETLNSFEKVRLAQGYSINTLIACRSDIRQFLFFIEDKGYVELSETKRQDISEYIPILSKRNPGGISDSLTRLRSFFRYLIEQRLVDTALMPSLQVVPARHKKIRFGFSADEINKLLQAVDQSTGIGKRDYAILLLAKHTGLRSIDVMNLKLQDINWKNSEIQVVQHKTKHPLILPLENNVGNAIAGYILNSRPTSDSEYVFLRSKAPYTALCNACGSATVRRYAKRAGITWSSSEYKGFHSFRRALGTHMLAANVSVNTISEVLGHSDIRSTEPYISTNLEQLKICPLSLDGFKCTKEVLQ